MACRVEVIGIKQWLELAKDFNDYNYTHFWEYAFWAAEKINAISEHIAVYDDNDLLSVCNIRIKKIPLGLGGIAYISGGPMIDKGQETLKEDLFSVLMALKYEYVDNRNMVLRISQRHKEYSLWVKENLVYHEANFVKHSKTNATILIDLSADIDVIRKKFHQKWRNVLNKSERQEIKIISGTSLSLFEDFSQLFEDLVSRKRFDVDMDDTFFATVQKLSLEQEKFHMAIAYSDGHPVGGHLSSICGDTSVYILGATNDVGRKLGAAYLLQWHAITESKSRQCLWYDLGGVDKVENPNVYRFKQRMNGNETELGNVFQEYKGLKGKLVLFIEKIYLKVKKNITP